MLSQIPSPWYILQGAEINGRRGARLILTLRFQAPERSRFLLSALRRRTIVNT
jgi:hypothetical protein